MLITILSVNCISHHKALQTGPTSCYEVPLKPTSARVLKTYSTQYVMMGW